MSGSFVVSKLSRDGVEVNLVLDVGDTGDTYVASEVDLGVRLEKLKLIGADVWVDLNLAQIEERGRKIVTMNGARVTSVSGESSTKNANRVRTPGRTIVCAAMMKTI